MNNEKENQDWLKALAGSKNLGDVSPEIIEAQTLRAAVLKRIEGE